MRVLLCGESWVTHSLRCAPRWAPPELLAWPGYAVLWPDLVRWAGRDAGERSY